MHSLPPLSSRTSTIRSIWRASGKRVLADASSWLERRRFHQLFSSLQKPCEAGSRIEGYLRSDKAFCVARMGHVEARLLGEWSLRSGAWSRATFLEAHANAGVFPVTDQGLSRFAQIYQESLNNVDLLGFWQSAYQAVLVSQLTTAPELCPLSALEPFRQATPWSQALAGRSVLVVHPFADSILSQYRLHGSRLFSDSRVLPSFDLQVFRPPVTHAPLTEGFQTWGDAYRRLHDRVLSMNFDVAILGCGSYGLPLAAAIKRHGRQSIHLGGALQLLFGILGRRWDEDSQIQQLVSANWIRPSSSETPACASSIEGGCYW